MVPGQRRGCPLAGHSTAWPRLLPFPGSGPGIPWHCLAAPVALGTAGLEGSEGKSGLGAGAVPASTTPTAPGPRHFPVPAKQPCSWEEFGCFLMPSIIPAFAEICFLSLSFIPTPSSHNTPQLPTPPSAHPSPLHRSTPASAVEGT